MKNLILLSTIFSFSFFSQSQVTDTVSLNAGLTNEAFYSLLNGELYNDINNDWDIAFQTNSTFSTSILINDGAGTELYLYPGTVADWTTLDTTGMISTWTQRYNSDTSWSYGAFSTDQSGFDVGWGAYNMITHQITGDRLFVIKLSNNTYQKIWIKSLISGVFEFRHANLNNTMDMTHTLSKSNFSTKNFGYYSLQNHSSKDKEPASTDWDLYFGKFTAFIPSEYLVTGILQNENTEAAKVYPVNDPSTYIDWQTGIYSKQISTIGHDWKTFNMSTFQYDIADSTVYFVKTQNNDVFKLIFKHFGGSGTGDIVFTKEHIHFSGIESENIASLIELYPNPANDIINVVYHSNQNLNLTLLDISGKAVLNSVLPANQFVTTISVFDIKTGVYILRLSNNNTFITKKLSIN